MSRRSPIRDARILALARLLKLHPAGVTVDDIMVALNVPHKTANDTIRQLRMQLGNLDSAWVVAEPQGQRERWRYRLVGAHWGLEVADPEGQWITNRIGDCETRIDTMLGLMNAAVRDTNPNTVEGRKARVLRRLFTRAQEDLADIDGKLFPS